LSFRGQVPGDPQQELTILDLQQESKILDPQQESTILDILQESTILDPQQESTIFDPQQETTFSAMVNKVQLSFRGRVPGDPNQRKRIEATEKDDSRSS
jgi:hypothetical protein